MRFTFTRSFLLAYVGNSSCSINVDFSDASCDASNPSTQINNEIIEYRQEWPFKKKSPVWANIESLEVFKKRPQKPHFGDLKDVDESFREGSAIGLMVTFANVVEDTLELPVDDPNDIINKSLKDLVKLETEHDFNVDFVRVRLTELLRKKRALGQAKGDSEVVQKKLEKLQHEYSKIDEEANEQRQEFENKIMAETEKKKKVKDGEIIMLQSSLELVDKQIKEFNVGYVELAATPFY